MVTIKKTEWGVVARDDFLDLFGVGPSSDIALSDLNQKVAILLKNLKTDKRLSVKREEKLSYIRNSYPLGGLWI